jgi:hypothetical protein
MLVGLQLHTDTTKLIRVTKVVCSMYNVDSNLSSFMPKGSIDKFDIIISMMEWLLFWRGSALARSLSKC